MHKSNWAQSEPYQGEDWIFSKQDVAQRLWQGRTDTAQWLFLIAEELHGAGGILEALLKAEMSGPGKI